MPVTYRPQFNGGDDISDSEGENFASSSAPTDADDAIVLSDLVRTGEASRLRRRGAMRLDHHTHQRSPTIIVVAEPTWESDSDEPSSLSLPQRRTRNNGRNRPTRRHAIDDELDFSYTLFCGGEETDHAVGEFGDSTPFVPSVLPVHSLTPPSSRRRTPASCTKQRTRRTNGCGALVHLSAAPRPRSGSSSSPSTWVAHRTASNAVVPVDPIYLDSYPTLLPRIVKHQRPSCQCVREAVACAVCGNILGRRFRGCKSSSSISGLGPQYRPREDEGVMCPQGTRYWREASQHGGESYMYTFLASAVSSSPSYIFPTCASFSSSSTSAAPHPAPNTVASSSSTTLRQMYLARNSYSDRDRDRDRDPAMTMNPDADPESAEQSRSNHPLTILDRLITASPTPLSDEEREAYRARAPLAVRPRYSFGYYGYPGAPGGYRVSSSSSGGGGGSGGGGALMYDADGEIMDMEDFEMDNFGEPGSPEKTGDMVLLPER